MDYYYIRDLGEKFIFISFFGLEFYLFYEFFTIFFGGFLGIYLFYVQHQFENKNPKPIFSVFYYKFNDMSRLL